jgi:pimeloyl-ACP methyl ester carboxylesterase
MKLVRWLAALAAAAGISVAFANDARDAGALSVERFGTRGSPVVLVPGLASGAWVWKDTIDALKETHRVYAVTLAGFDGRAAVTGEPMRAALDALRDLVVKENLEKPVIVGHSLGGMLALQLAAAYPDLLGGVVTVDGSPVFPTTENVPSAERAALGERMRAQFAEATPSQFEAQQLAYIRRVGVIDESRAAQAAALTARSDPRAVGAYAKAAMTLDFRADLAAIRVPVLAIVPYYASDYAAMGVSEEAKRAYYTSLLRGVGTLEVVTIAPARHFVMLDQPEALAAAVRKFVDARTASR